MLLIIGRLVDACGVATAAAPRPAAAAADSAPASVLEQLHLVEPRVGAVRPREQLVVAADLDDAAALEHDDRIGAADRREPVRDDERGAVQHQRRQRVLHQALRFGVERRGRLVEDRIGESFSSARAIASRWRWPPDSRWPRSPIVVW